MPSLMLPSSGADPEGLRTSEAVRLFLARARAARPRLPDDDRSARDRGPDLRRARRPAARDRACGCPRESALAGGHRESALGPLPLPRLLAPAVLGPPPHPQGGHGLELRAPVARRGDAAGPPGRLRRRFHARRRREGLPRRRRRSRLCAGRTPRRDVARDRRRAARRDAVPPAGDGPAVRGGAARRGDRRADPASTRAVLPGRRGGRGPDRGPAPGPAAARCGDRGPGQPAQRARVVRGQWLGRIRPRACDVARTVLGHPRLARGDALVRRAPGSARGRRGRTHRARQRPASVRGRGRGRGAARGRRSAVAAEPRSLRATRRRARTGRAPPSAGDQCDAPGRPRPGARAGRAEPRDPRAERRRVGPGADGGDVGGHRPRCRRRAGALAYMEASAGLAHDAGFPWWESGMLAELANLSLDAGRIDEGERRARTSLALAEQMGDRPGRVFGIGLLARVAAEQGQRERRAPSCGPPSSRRTPAPRWAAGAVTATPTRRSCGPSCRRMGPRAIGLARRSTKRRPWPSSRRRRVAAIPCDPNRAAPGALPADCKEIANAESHDRGEWMGRPRWPPPRTDRNRSAPLDRRRCWSP